MIYTNNQYNYIKSTTQQYPYNTKFLSFKFRLIFSLLYFTENFSFCVLSFFPISV